MRLLVLISQVYCYTIQMMGQFGPSNEILFDKETQLKENFLWKIVTGLQPVKFKLELDLPCESGTLEFFVQNNQQLKKVCGRKTEVFGIQSSTVMILLSSSVGSSFKLKWSPLGETEAIVRKSACFAHTCSGH